MTGPIGKRRIRLPMFFKFLAGCLSLAALLIVGGTMVVRNETKQKNRGNYLAQAQRRLDGYIERVGRGMTGTLEQLATDDELEIAVTGKGDPDKPPITKQEGREHAKKLFDSISTKNGIKPDLFAIFTTANEVVWEPPQSPLLPADLPLLAAVEKARNGSVFAHRIQLLHNVPYEVSAMPIRNGKDEVVGGVLIGVAVQRYYEEWADQSDDLAELRMRPVLIDKQNILASAWAPERRAELASALQPDKFVQVRVGNDERDVIRMKDGDYDFYGIDLEGFKDDSPGVVGKLYITRSRVDLGAATGTVPVIEIIVGIVASLLIAMVMAIWITRPINQMVKQSRDLLAGDTDLTQRIVVDSNDETADLAENINRVFARVHDLATRVQAAAFQVGASSAEISAAARTMLGGLKDQTLKIESSTTAVTELSASIQEVAGNATAATRAAATASASVGAAVRRMEQIRTSVDDAGAKMRELGESSKRIGNIVEVIRQISEQTSMLALNASIEAAHAGEQGRGFAVVADEVSSLARRVGQSAKDIETLIQTVKEQTHGVTLSMEVGTREVVGGSELVTGTLTGLGELIAVITETANAVREQAVVSDEIARNMDAVRQIAADVLGGSEESVVQSERLHELAFELEQSIGGFNLDGQRVGGTGTEPGREARKQLAARRGAR